MATLESIQSDIAALAKELKSVAKLVRKVRATQEDPDGEKAKSRSANNGFNRPLNVSEELRGFLGLAAGETISRSEVTSRLTKYVKENDLKHPENGRVIILDAKLTALLNPPKDVQVNFLNVQKYLSPHYSKIEAEPATAVDTAAAVAAKPKRPVVRKPAAT